MHYIYRMSNNYSAFDFDALYRRLHTVEIAEKLSSAVVGIAGLGGLGSNAAVALARAGIGTLILVDFDRVEFSNLNRQYYMLDDIGRYKADALKERLKKINPFVRLMVHNEKITRENCLLFFKEAAVVIEAVDEPSTKELVIESILSGSRTMAVVAGSGMGGVGKNNDIKERKVGRLTVVGDEKTAVEEGVPLLAPRVCIVANMQANAAIEILLKEDS